MRETFGRKAFTITNFGDIPIAVSHDRHDIDRVMIPQYDFISYNQLEQSVLVYDINT
jgi:hypothetical protein